MRNSARDDSHLYLAAHCLQINLTVRFSYFGKIKVALPRRVLAMDSQVILRNEEEVQEVRRAKAETGKLFLCDARCCLSFWQYVCI